MREDPLKQYRLDVLERVSSYRENNKLQQAVKSFHDELVHVKYAYNFFWLGVPILQEPQDLQAIQEIFWEVKPDLVIETGIAHGGSLIMSASMLALLDYCEATECGELLPIRRSSNSRLTEISRTNFLLLPPLTAISNALSDSVYGI